MNSEFGELTIFIWEFGILKNQGFIMKRILILVVEPF